MSKVYWKRNKIFLNLLLYTVIPCFYSPTLGIFCDLCTFEPCHSNTHRNILEIVNFSGFYSILDGYHKNVKYEFYSSYLVHK